MTHDILRRVAHQDLPESGRAVSGGHNQIRPGPGSAGNPRESSRGRKRWRFHDLSMTSLRLPAPLRLRNTGPFLLRRRRFLKVAGGSARERFGVSMGPKSTIGPRGIMFSYSVICGRDYVHKQTFIFQIHRSMMRRPPLIIGGQTPGEFCLGPASQNWTSDSQGTERRPDRNKVCWCGGNP